jgi:hypothetical protein
VRGWADNAGRAQRFPPEVTERLAQAGCPVDFPSQLLVAAESPECRRLAVEVARALDVGGLLYRYQGIAFDACRGRQTGSFILLRPEQDLARATLMTSQPPRRERTPVDHLLVREMFRRARQAGSLHPAPWPELEGRAVPLDTPAWMREHLFGCGGHVEDRMPGTPPGEGEGEKP